MKLEVSRKELFTAVQEVKSQVSGRSTLPILANVCLRAVDSTLQVTTTDLEGWLQVYVPCQVAEEGAFTLPCRLLEQMLKGESDTVELDGPKPDSDELTITSAEDSVSLRGLPAEEYPSFPKKQGDHVFTCESAVLRQWLERVLFAASTDETRAILNGVCFGEEDGMLRLTVTDGYRLASVETDIRAKIAKDEAGRQEIIIPARLLSRLHKLLPKKGANGIDMYRSENQVFLAWPGHCLVSRILEGTFPAFRKVVWKSDYIEAIGYVNRPALVKALKKLKPVAAAEADKIVFCWNGNLELRASSCDYGAAKMVLSCRYHGDPMDIAFNAGYLLDALESIPDEQIAIQMQDYLKPVKIEAAHSLNVIAPVQVS